MDSGFGRALIRKADRTEMDYATAFYFNLCSESFISSGDCDIIRSYEIKEGRHVPAFLRFMENATNSDSKKR